MEDWDMNLLPPEPYKYAEQQLVLTCTNDDCALFEHEVLEILEVEYWEENRAIYTWTCESCQHSYDEEFNPNDYFDWDSYYKDRRD